MSAANVRNLKMFTQSEISHHKTRNDIWVTYRGKVYNVTKMLDDHPGGPELLLEFAGSDVGAAMAGEKGADLHKHSASALDMLEEYCIGKLAASDQSLVDPNWVVTDNFHPEESDPQLDLKRSEFLDLSKPLVMQVLRSNWSKEFYLQQVHQPRHLNKPATLLGPPWLEALTKTPWYVVPLFWGPICLFLFYKAMLNFSSPQTESIGVLNTLKTLTHHQHPITVFAFFTTLALWISGLVLWTILEYVFHRFLFHVDNYLPDHPVFFALHFLTHGVHHYLPMDRLRLVMPPTLFGLLQLPFTQLSYTLLPNPICNGVISGVFTMYIGYDLTHYALHHTALPRYLKEIKSYHLAHHYRNYESGFGVTSRFWDWVFGTEIIMSRE